MGDEVYYRVENMDSRIENVDQCLTVDIAKFSESLSELLGNLGKPILDISLFTSELVQNVGTGSMMGAYGVTVCSFLILRACTPPFGRLVAEQAQLEGHQRSLHSRVIVNAEEIAFYGGAKVEGGHLHRAYIALAKHLNGVYKRKLYYETIENFLLKCVCVCVCVAYALAVSASRNTHPVGPADWA